MTHVGSVGDVVAVEGNGIAAYRTGEGILEQSHVVVIDIHIGKALDQDLIDNVARLEQVVHAGRVLSLDDGLLGMRVLAIELLSDLFLDRQRQDKLLVVLAHLDLIEQPLTLLE